MLPLPSPAPQFHGGVAAEVPESCATCNRRCRRRRVVALVQRRSGCSAVAALWPAEWRLRAPAWLLRSLRENVYRYSTAAVPLLLCRGGTLRVRACGVLRQSVLVLLC